MNGDPELIERETKDEEIRELKHRTEIHDYEIILKPPKNDNEDYRKKYKSLNKKNYFKLFQNF